MCSAFTLTRNTSFRSPVPGRTNENYSGSMAVDSAPPGQSVTTEAADPALVDDYQKSEMKIGSMQTFNDRCVQAKGFIMETLFGGLKFYKTTGIKTDEDKKEEDEICKRIMLRVDVEPGSAMAEKLWTSSFSKLIGETLRTRRNTVAQTVKREFQSEW